MVARAVTVAVDDLVAATAGLALARVVHTAAASPMAAVVIVFVPADDIVVFRSVVSAARVWLIWVLRWVIMTGSLCGPYARATGWWPGMA